MRRSWTMAAALCLTGPAGADTAAPCAAQPEPIRNHATRLAASVAATDEMLDTLDGQVAALEERLTSGANATQIYVLLETTLNLRGELAAQQAETEALVAALCPPEEME